MYLAAYIETPVTRHSDITITFGNKVFGNGGFAC